MRRGNDRDEFFVGFYYIFLGFLQHLTRHYYYCYSILGVSIGLILLVQFGGQLVWRGFRSDYVSVKVHRG